MVTANETITMKVSVSSNMEEVELISTETETQEPASTVADWVIYQEIAEVRDRNKLKQHKKNKMMIMKKSVTCCLQDKKIRNNSKKTCDSLKVCSE